jgi:hypothetical protein
MLNVEKQIKRCAVAQVNRAIRNSELLVLLLNNFRDGDLAFSNYNEIRKANNEITKSIHEANAYYNALNVLVNPYGIKKTT